MSGWDGRGSNRAWRRFRAHVLERNERDNNGRCQLQFPGCQGLADQVHHPEPWEGRPEDLDPNKAMATCGPCNRRAGWTPPTPTDPEPKPWTMT